LVALRSPDSVCEQSASVLGSHRRVHQFVKKAHQIVTVGAFQKQLLGNKKCVVEHKGSSDALADFVD
jgi:hypothetical protein